MSQEESTIVPICIDCKHFDSRPTSDLSCTAFPERIPDAILNNEHDHRKPYPNDNGIRFEKARPSQPMVDPFADDHFHEFPDSTAS